MSKWPIHAVQRTPRKRGVADFYRWRNKMNQVASFINSINVIWLIPIFLFIHELEEWNILSWYKKYFNNLPGSTNVSIRIHIFTFGIVGFLITILAYISPAVIKSLLIIFLSGFVLTNTIQHIIQTFQYGSYAPGLSTGIICTAACVLVNVVLVQKGMIFIPLYFIILLGIPTVIKTIKLKHEMTPEIRRIHELFIGIENKLRPSKNIGGDV